MSEQEKRLPWRCKNAKQAKDKATIYNSREWRELRAAKLRSQPLCEAHLKVGIVKSAHCVHHIIPIESARTREEMWRLGVECGLSGLMSLCDQCHADIHKEAGSHTKEKVAENKARARRRFMEANDPSWQPPTDDHTT